MAELLDDCIEAAVNYRPRVSKKSEKKVESKVRQISKAKRSGSSIRKLSLKGGMLFICSYTLVFSMEMLVKQMKFLVLPGPPC